MNNNITEDYCSFEVSKLLKEKGAKLQTHYNTEARMHLWWHVGGGLYSYDFFGSFDNMVPAPTHALAIKWIRENFGIHIYVDNNHIHKWWYCVHVIGTPDRYDASQFKLPEEATEAALKYTLNNLI